MFLTDENLLEHFNNYLKCLKEGDQSIKCDDFTISDIYKLLAISNLKAIYEYLKMYDLDDSSKEKVKIDFLLLAYDIIQQFYYLLRKINFYF